jgi:ATP-dependent DNA helicase RecQ
LELDGTEYPILKLNANSREILFGEAQPRLIRTASKVKERKQVNVSEAASHSDSGLFEKLRSLRRRLAQDQNVPPFVVFADSVLMEMSATRPSTLEQMLKVSGIGKRKLSSYGATFLEAITEHCQTIGLDMDVQWKSQLKNTETATRTLRSSSPGKKSLTFPMLREGRSFEEIAQRAELTVGTVAGHLLDLIQEEPVPTIDAWVATDLQKRIIQAADTVGRDRLKPIFEHLQQSVGYETIRLVLAFERQQSAV